MRIRYAGKLWDVQLEDDGTMDTVVSVSPVTRPRNTAENANKYPNDSQGPYYPWQEVRFDSEYASEHRRPNGEMTMRGLRILGQEAAEAYDFDLD